MDVVAKSLYNYSQEINPNYFLEGATLWGTKVRPWRSARPDGDIPFLKVIWVYFRESYSVFSNTK